MISSEWTLYRLSILYLPGLTRGSITTLFLYLAAEEAKEEKRTESKLSRQQAKEESRRRAAR